MPQHAQTRGEGSQGLSSPLRNSRLGGFLRCSSTQLGEPFHLRATEPLVGFFDCLVGRIDGQIQLPGDLLYCGPSWGSFSAQDINHKSGHLVPEPNMWVGRPVPWLFEVEGGGRI
jgi:hypothetical protein